MSVSNPYADLIASAYGTIGRSGFGTGANQIDQGGFDYWTNQLTSGALTPDTFGAAFNSAVNNYLETKPDDAYSTQVNSYLNSPEVLVNNLYGSIGRIDPATIDQEGRDYWTNEIKTKGYDAVAPVFADSAVRTYSNFIDNPNTAQYGDQLKTGFTNLANSGVASLLADKNLSLDEAYQFKKFGDTYGATPDQLSQYVTNGSTIVPRITNAFDTGVSALVSKALDPATTELDKAKIQLGLMQRYGLTYQDIAERSGGKLTVDQVTGFLEPIKNYGTDFLGKLRGEEYLNADQLSQFLNSNTVARQIYSGQQDFFDALAASKSAAATPQQIAAIAKYLGYTNGWENPASMQPTGGSQAFYDRFVGKPIQDFITYAITRSPGGEQGGPADLRERAGKLLSPLQGMAVDERTVEEFYRGVADGTISEADANSVGVNKGYAIDQLREMADPLVNWGESQVRLSDLRRMGVPEETIASLTPAAAGKTPAYVRDPLTGKWIFAGGTSSDDGSVSNGFDANGVFASYGNQLGGPDGTKKVSVSNLNNYKLDPNSGEVVFSPGVHAYSDTSFLREVLPIALAMASFIPGVAPFAQIANAGLSLHNGNIVGGIAGLLGASMPGAEAVMGANGVASVPTIAQTLGVPTGITSGLNIANAIQNKDLLALLTQGANLGGVDLKGLDIGGMPLDKLLQGIGAVQAVQNGNIGALMGLAGQTFDMPDLVKASQAVRTAQAFASGNPNAIASAIRALPKTPAPGNAKGGLLSEEDPDGKVRPYYSGVASLLH